MKLQNLFRTQVLVIGFGAALLMTTTAQAQEIDNIVWDDNPNNAAAVQPATPPVPSTYAANTAADSGALNLVAMRTTSNVARGSSMPHWNPAKDWMAVSLLVTITVVGLYLLQSTRRAHQTRNTCSDQLNRKTALS